METGNEFCKLRVRIAWNLRVAFQQSHLLSHSYSGIVFLPVKTPDHIIFRVAAEPLYEMFEKLGCLGDAIVRFDTIERI